MQPTKKARQYRPFALKTGINKRPTNIHRVDDSSQCVCGGGEVKSYYPGG